MIDIGRNNADRSITQRIVEAIEAAIERGELSAGDRLPPTRELAELAAINHLTAVRAYRRLRELGLVQARVGSGTFVRDPRARVAEPPARRTTSGNLPAPPEVDTADWQRYVLAEADEDPTGRAMATFFEREDVIPLALAYPPADLLPAEAWARHTAAVLAELGPAALQYGPVEGVSDLRRQIARRAGEWERPEDVVAVSGAMQGITIVARTLVRPGDLVACETPSYHGMMEALRSAGGNVVPIPVDEDGLDVDALAELVMRHDVRLVALQSVNHNPTGAELAPDRARRLVELARRHGFFVVDDEAWSGLRFDGADPPPLRELAPGHVIAIGSASKMAGGGLRLGWLRASGPIVELLVRAKRLDDVHSAALIQYAAARFMASGEYDAQVAAARDAYSERWDATRAALERHLAGVVRYTTPVGGGNTWVTLERPVDEDALMEEAARAGVSVLPGSAISIERPAGTSFRLAFSFAPVDAIDPGVRRLAHAIRTVRLPARRTTITWPVA